VGWGFEVVVRKMEGLRHDDIIVLGEDDSVVKQMVEEFLPKLLIHIIACERTEQRKRRVAVNCIVGGGKKSAAIEPVEGGDKPRALKETKEGRVVGILSKLDNERV
jgi:hypothetical protein